MRDVATEHDAAQSQITNPVFINVQSRLSISLSRLQLYWKNAQLCQQFYYRPSTYAIQQDCVSYQVTSIGALKQYSETIGFHKDAFGKYTAIVNLSVSSNVNDYTLFAKSTTRFVMAIVYCL